MFTLVSSLDIIVNYDQSVRQLVESTKSDYANPYVTEENFPSEETGTAQVTICLTKFDRKDHNAEDILKELDRHGLRPATLKELLCLSAAHPNLQRKHTIIALGSSWLPPDGDVGVPVIWGRNGGQIFLGYLMNKFRGLELYWRDEPKMDRRWLYAAVKKEEGVI